MDISASPPPIPESDYTARLGTPLRRAEELEHEIVELCANLNAATYRLLVLIRELDDEKPWGAWGLTCAHWLNWKCGIGLVAAREKIRVAYALVDLPKISKAFERGEVSYSKVRAMTRVAIPENEEYLLEMATHGTASHVERLVRKYRSVERREELERVGKHYDGRYLKHYTEEDGSVVIRAKLPPEVGAVVIRALELCADEIFREDRVGRTAEEAPPEASPGDSTGDSAEASAGKEERQGQREHGDDSAEAPRPGEVHLLLRREYLHPELEGEEDTPATRWADALVRMVESWLETGGKAFSGGDKHQIVVHIDAETLRAGAAGRSHLEDGPWLAAETVRRLGCEASAVGLIENEEGEVLSVGRKTRTIPPAIARALRARDTGCRFPGCTHTRFLDGHHIHHWADGGETKLGNLLQLCRTHHRLVHEGGFTVETDENGEFLFKRPSGEVIEAVPKVKFRRALGVVNLRTQHRDLGLGITHRTGIPRWDGRPMDYFMAVEGMLKRRGEGAPPFNG